MTKRTKKIIVNINKKVKMIHRKHLIFKKKQVKEEHKVHETCRKQKLFDTNQVISIIILK